MNTADVVAMLRTHGVREVAQAIQNPGIQAMQGWDLTDWRTQTVAGARAIFRVDAQGRTVAVVAVINAPQSAREHWWAVLADARGAASAPTTLLLQGEWRT